MVVERRHGVLRKHRALARHGFPGLRNIVLLPLPHRHHGAVMLAIPPAAGRQGRFRIGKNSMQSGVAGKH